MLDKHMINTLDLPAERRTLGAILALQAEQRADQEFLVYGDRTWTYKEFDSWVDTVSAGLAELGLHKGDKLAIMLPNCAEFMALWFACARLGLIEVPVNTSYRGPLLRHLLDHSDARMAVLSEEYVERLQNEAVGFCKLEKLVVWSATGAPKTQGLGIPAMPFSALNETSGRPPEVPVTHRDPVSIMYSSGTTGPSKGILLCHNYFWWGGSHGLRNGGLRDTDRLYTCLPLFHANAQLTTAMPALLAGATFVLDDRFSASNFWVRLRELRATSFAYIGGMIPILLKQPPSPEDRAHGVERASGGGAPARHWREFEERFGLKIYEGYGQTENCVALSSPRDATRVGSMGLPNCGYEVQLVDDNDEPVGANTIGELVFRPEHPYIMMDGYYKNPEATLEQSRNLWFHTGDLMKRDEDGYYYFVDRKKDAIRRRGENISAFEVEMVLNGHPSILESAAIAVPSEVGEDEVMVCVVPKPDQTVDPLELIKHCEKLMAYFSVPRFVDIRAELPKTPTHRVEKYRLRQEGITSTTWDREKSGYQIKR